MSDNLSKNIERTTAIIDLLAAVVFLAVLLKVFTWVDGLLEILK